MISQTYADVRVVELGTTIAGPFCGLILADLGADVIKVERPGGGDDSRSMPPHVDGESAVFSTFNRGKRSVVLDLQQESGREVFRRLCAGADVLVNSLRPTATASLGIGYDALRLINRELVYCAVSAFGQSGSMATRAGYDPLVQAFTGLMSMTGHPGGEPARVPASVTDLTTGMWAAIGIMAALARRAGTGEGALVEAALVDAGFALLSHQVAALQATGAVPSPSGSASPIAAPYEAFRTLDRWVLVAAGNQQHFVRLCNALDLADLITDPRFTTMGQRVAHRDELHAVIEEVLLQAPADHWIGRLVAADIPVGPVNDLREALADPLVEERHLLAAASGRAPMRPMRLPIDSTWPPRLGVAPSLGQHTSDVLAELGLDGGEWPG